MSREALGHAVFRRDVKGHPVFRPDGALVDDCTFVEVSDGALKLVAGMETRSRNTVFLHTLHVHAPGIDRPLRGSFFTRKLARNDAGLEIECREDTIVHVLHHAE
ncbi:hypothetical protein D3C81_1631650 [compost metagenome]